MTQQNHLPSWSTMAERDQINPSQVHEWRASRAPRTIHYLGGKSRVLGAIHGALDSVAGPKTTVCDLFSGSGVVAGSLVHRRPVIAADIQEYARVLAAALLRPADLTAETDRIVDGALTRFAQLQASALGPLLVLEDEAARHALDGDAGPLCEIVDHGSIRASSGSPPSSPLSTALSTASDDPRLASARMTSYYGGVYFSYRQAAELDALAWSIQELGEHRRGTALAALISSASEVVGTVGSHFAQPARMRTSSGAVKGAAVRKALRYRSSSVLDAFTKWIKTYSGFDEPSFVGVSIQGDYRNVLRDLPADVAAIYADPPYTRDHYSRFYHVLETLAIGDDPGLSTTRSASGEVPTRGLYRRDRHQSPFCIATQVEDAFLDLFRGTARREIPLVLSYSPLGEGTAARPKTRLMGVDQLKDLARTCFSEVTVETAGQVAHSKLNASHLNAAIAYDAEVLIVCVP